MSGSSIAAVIDYLVEQIRALPSCADPVRVFDGFPDTEAATYVMVGGHGQDVSGDSRQVWHGMGRLTREEDYDVTGEIYAATGSTDQKSVRDKVFAIEKDLAAFLRADPRLGGLVTQYAELATVSLEQTDEETADEGRFALLTFKVHVINRIT